MASPQSHPLIVIPTLIPLLFITLLRTILSQNPSSSSPTIAECASHLLPLAPCAPFVQGTAQSPAQMCCNNLEQLYSQEPHCLCLLINDTTSISSFPINTTLALQLPNLCKLQADISACSASPMVQVQPRPNIMGLGFGSSLSTKLKAKGDFTLVVTMAAFLLGRLL
ncbi:hypothetical protein CIPAW_15G129400 [Carya illinoinensis]|uniref:Bifunctional inhibitor/plant lipid transfer protein/seed storage helical domain-containing protein n=1 Tax=Carya illinoinensis TaxID=32201 RepID=A0A8T1NF06_CARIL|nr:hypothetical protein CIPAW_15G129400 [Carya illinoinensis]